MRARIAAVILFASALPAWAIEGRYKVEGQNPGQSQIYKGDVIVKKTGETYSVVWQIGQERQIGTGILTGSVLSVVFQTVGSSAGGSGVASFAITDGKVRDGRWTVIGGSATGVERWNLDSAL